MRGDIGTWIRHRFHGSGYSRALRKIPLIGGLAMQWWVSSQTRILLDAMSSLPSPVIPGMANEESRPAVPEVQELVGGDATALRTAGDSFATEMAMFCSTDKFSQLGYQDIYASVIRHLRGSSPRVLEIGIGVNDPFVPSGMPGTHKPGSSLVGWRNYLGADQVHGADIDLRVVRNTNDYLAHWVDQRDITSLQALVNVVGVPLDLVVDDGLHTLEANANVIFVLLPHLSTRGVFVIEDVLPYYEEAWVAALHSLPPSYVGRFYPGKVLRGDRTSGLVVLWRR